MPLAFSATEKSVTVQKTNKQKKQQACKMHTPPYGLSLHRCPQFRLPTKPRRWLWYLLPGTHIGHPNTISYEHVIHILLHRDIHPGSNAAPVTPHESIFAKREKTCLDSRPTRMQNFMPLAFSATEKSVTVQTNKQTKTNKNTGN